MKVSLMVVLLGCLVFASAKPRSHSRSGSSSRSSSKSDSGSSSRSDSRSGSRSDSRSSSRSDSRSDSIVSSAEEPVAVVSEEDASVEDTDGGYAYISVHEGLILEPEDPPKDLTSMNYPDQAPADLRQSWSIRSYSPDYPTKLQITCEEFDLPQVSNRRQNLTEDPNLNLQKYFLLIV